MFKAIYGDTGSLSRDELETRRIGLQDLVRTLGWWCMITSLFYFIFYFVMRYGIKGHTVIEIMTVVALPLVYIKGVALIYGVSKEKQSLLEIGLLFTFIQGVYESAYGITGATQFVHTKHITTHLILFIMFITMSLSILRAIFFDLILVNAYKNTIASN